MVRKYLGLKTFLSTWLTVTIVLSAFMTVLSTSSATAQMEGDISDVGTYISWEQEHESEVESLSWTSLTWEFGPYPQYVILLSNGTAVTDFNFIPLDEDFAIVIDVKKDIFKEDNLGGVSINWHAEVLNQSNPQDDLGWANARMEYINYVIGEAAGWHPPNSTWSIWSEVFNKTKQELEMPKIQFGADEMIGGYGDVPIQIVTRLNSTSLWDQSTPDQTLPPEDSTSNPIGVQVGDWATYDFNVYVPNYEPKTYHGPGNETVRMDVINVEGTNVTFTLTHENLADPNITSHWIDVSTGKASDEEVKGCLVTANLNEGDLIVPTEPFTIEGTELEYIGGSQRIVNYLKIDDMSLAWDRSAGILSERQFTEFLASSEGPRPDFHEPDNSFYVWNSDASMVNETDTNWKITIIGKFNSTHTPQGPYNVNLEVYNSVGDRIEFGYAAWADNASPWRMVAVGKPGLIYSGFNEYWNFAKLDMKGQPVYTVARGQPWVMRVNVTSPDLANLANVTLAFDIEDNIKTYVNVTNWHTQTVTETGGWMYNTSSQTYFWNESVQIVRTEEVYGSHLEERWLWLPHQHEVEVTRRYWNETNGEEELATFIETVWGEKLFLVYDHQTSSFTVKQGYSYWSYDPQGGYEREFKMLRPLNTSDLTTRFYALDLNRCRVYETVPGTLTVEFVGSFNETVYSTRDQYWIQQPTIQRTDGRDIWADWESVDLNAFEIAVDRMVAITKIIDQDGRELDRWMFNAEPGEWFIVQSTLQGAMQIYDDLDSAGVRFHMSEGSWTPTENYWSDVEIGLVYDKYDGSLTSETFNRTEQSIYEYGPHIAWTEVEVLGYHDEYNVTTKAWEWVNGTYTTWEYVNVTEWYWNYRSLNLTELARDPSSPAIWIDRDEQWIPWEDPAFREPESYATLNSANLSLDEGLVIANLNVTFNAKAPDACYWWEVTFGNRTFGEDWSRGWGEHTVTDWTEETVRYINSSETQGEKWYVTTPLQPFYTVYNGTRFRVHEIPYIVLAGTTHYIDTRSFYDYGSSTERTEMLLRDPWDPLLEEEPRYYQLLNGTKVYLSQGHKVLIRDITLNCNDVYRLDGGERIYLPNQTTFTTAMDHAQEDWSGRYWDDVLMREVVPYFYELVNGTRVYDDVEGDVGFEGRNWNQTTNRYDLTDKKYDEESTSLMVDYSGRCVFLDGTIFVELRGDGSWWQYSPSGGKYYLVMKNGTRIFHPNPWDYSDEERTVTIGGNDYTIGSPTEYYSGTYQDSTLTIKGGGEGFVRDFYYTVLEDIMYEMPHAGAFATSWWDLENIESRGGRVPTGKSIIIDGSKYPIHQSGSTAYIVIDGTVNAVTHPKKDASFYYSLINGLEFWNVTQGGWSLLYGTYHERIGQIDPVIGTLVTTTGYDPDAAKWSEWDRYGEDRENSTRYLVVDGQRVDVYEGRYLSIWEVVIAGQTYYTLDGWDRSEMVQNPATGEMVWKQYVQTIDSTKVYFDWSSDSVNWVKEHHVELPRTNYTQLVPYEWTNRSLLDKTYIYNITIVNNMENIYYQNGSVVVNGTTLKVWGSEIGPGVQVWRDEWDPTTDNVWGLPWDDEEHAYYLETLTGERIYGYGNRSDGKSEFGYDWSTYQYDPDQLQWNYNIDEASGKRSIDVTEGGYCIYMIDNATSERKRLVTATWWQEEYPDSYVLLPNGSRLDFTNEGEGYLGANWCWRRLSIVLGGTFYWVDGGDWMRTLFTVTDTGILYYLDNEQYRVRTTYLTPQVLTDGSKSMEWMNATSDKVIIDTSIPSNQLGRYYLVNASTSQQINLGLIDWWWSNTGLTDEIRQDVFQGPDMPWHWLREMYPRYNLTLNGIEYFVLDPRPTPNEWWPGQTWDHSGHPTSFTFNNATYPVDVNDWEGFRWRSYNAILVNGSIYELQEQWMWKPVHTIIINGIPNQITIAQENIFKIHTSWGPAYRWTLADLNIFTIKHVWDIVVGTPKSGMWGVKTYGIVPETGAVDLDGDLSTTSDQYYVRGIRTGTDLMNRTEDRMWIELLWNPDATILGDEVHMEGWMGKVHSSWTFTWNETYIWYHASNMSAVNSETLAHINATLVNVETGDPNPGYWEISRMVQNTTSEDLKAKAEKEGWDWIQDDTHEWEWVWFGLRQDYKSQWIEDSLMKTSDVGIQYEYAGLLLYNDTDGDGVMQQGETTNFFLPSKVNSITFTSPGEDFGNYNPSGSMTVDAYETVNFGVDFEGINGTLFPYDAVNPKDMWGWWDGNIYGADFNVPDMNLKPTNTGISDLEFMVHFNASVLNDASYNEAKIKIDERVGQWTIDPQVIDGRRKTLTNNLTTYLKGNEVFQDRSLALSWYVTAFTDQKWRVKDDQGTEISPHNVTSSETFDIAPEIATAKFATVAMGGTYDWKNAIAINDTIRTFNVSSYTTPVSTFQSSYISDSGKSSTGFDITSSMYFLTVGMDKWDGYPVYHDPSLVVYVGKNLAAAIPPFPDSIPTNYTSYLIATIVISSVVVAGVYLTKIKPSRVTRKGMELRQD